MFTPEISKRLGSYVYRLIDPRNGETFYVGKGKGNRVFQHAAGEIAEDSTNEKLERIRKIKLTRLKVVHLIHRHGMDEKTAFEVEAALIDAYPGLTNISDGHGNSDYGSMHANEIIERYTAREMEFKHKVLLISVNRSAMESSLYEAVRYAWRLDQKRAQRAEVVVATVQGLGVGAFIPSEWLDATSENFPGKGAVLGRFGFNGRKADEDIQKLYSGARTPDSYRKRGASNPIKYTYR